jgi:6-pyruvoyltetrahydropterin/6-carboxytetrahydropterin synthase
MSYTSTKIIELGSCAFRQPNAAFDRPGAGINSKRCSFVHGYKLQAKFWFECSHLDEKNWAVDFGGLSNLKLMLQHQFDHTLTVDKSDPLLPLFEELHKQGGCDLRVMDGVGIEKVSEWCFKVANQHIQEITNKRCWVSKVEVWEHDKNSAIYTE